MVRPLRQLVTDLQHSETVRVVRALQELWVERSAFGDCGLAADVLLETLVHRMLLLSPPPPSSSSAVDGMDGDEREPALESGLPGERQAELLARGEGFFRARQTSERGALGRRRGARRISGGGGDGDGDDEREGNLERVDEEPFTERAEELLLLLANELHRDRLRVSRRDDRGAGRLWLSSSLLSLYVATLLRSERSKAKVLGLVLLTRMPYAMTAKTVSLDNGRVVRTLLSDHVFLRQVAARALSQVLHKLVREVRSSATDLPDGMHAQYVQWLQRDIDFSRSLLAVYRGLLAALDDEDDEVFLEALRGLLRLAKVDDTRVAPDADAFAEHIFTTLDAVGPWLVRRFHHLEASEHKAQFLESMAGLVAHSVRRHEERTSAQQTTATAGEQPRNAAATATDRVAQPDWAFAFFSKVCIPLLHSEANMMRLRSESAEGAATQDLMGTADDSGGALANGETNARSAFDAVLWTGAVRFTLSLLGYPPAERLRPHLRDALPLVQAAVSREDRHSAFAAWHLRRLLHAARQLLDVPEERFLFLSRQLQVWRRLPRACQNRSHLLLLVSMLMDIAYEMPAPAPPPLPPKGVHPLKRAAAATTAAVTPERVASALFPPLRRNLIDDNLVLASDWSRHRDVVFCALLRVLGALRGLLVTSATVDPTTADRAVRVSAHFLNALREQVFRYYGLSCRYDTALAALTSLCADTAFYLRQCNASTHLYIASTFLMDTVRDCVAHGSSPAALKLYARGVCRVLPLLPPFEGEEELSEVLMDFLVRAVPHAAALPPPRKQWRCVTGMLRFTSATGTEAPGEPAGRNPMAQDVLLLAEASPAEELLTVGDEERPPNSRDSILGGYAAGDAETEQRPSRPRADSDARVVHPATIAASAAAAAVPSALDESAVRESNLDLIASIFEIQKRFPGIKSRGLRALVQQAGQLMTALEEGVARSLRDHVFLDVVNTTDSQLRFLRTAEYATPESRDALLRMMSTHGRDKELRAFSMWREGAARPLVAAHVADALVDAMRAMLLHQEALADMLREEWLATPGVDWTGALRAYQALLQLLPGASRDGPAEAFAPPTALTHEDAPVRMQLTHRLDAVHGVLEALVEVQFVEGASGVADVQVGYVGDGSEEQEVEEEEEEEEAAPFEDVGWLETPEEYITRVRLQHSGVVVARLPVRRGALYTTPVRVRLKWWPYATTTTTTTMEEESEPEGEEGVEATTPWLDTAPIERLSTRARVLPLELYPVDERSLLFLRQLPPDGIALDAVYALWDWCAARRTIAVAWPTAVEGVAPPTVSPARAVLDVLRGPFRCAVVASAPPLDDPARALLFARSTFHGCSVLTRLETTPGAAALPHDRKSTSSPGAWTVLTLRSEHTAFLNAFCSQFMRTLRDLDPTLEVRDRSDIPLRLAAAGV